MGLLDKTLIGALIGFGVGAYGKSALEAAGSAVRPLAKGLIAAGLAASEQAKTLAAEAVEHVNDLVAEVQSEHTAGRATKPRSGAHTTAT
jgi:hypothetical protein